jgi:hypothetical protein
MAEVNPLILPIGADATTFERTINDVKKSIKELGDTIKSKPFNLITEEQKKRLGQLEGTLKRLTEDVKNTGNSFKYAENSIQGITEKINQLNKKRISLDADQSAEEIARLQNEIDELIAKKNQIDILGRSVQNIAPSFQKVADSSKGARTALTSVNLIVQDLPFGFIAIQNNLPALIQTFNNLSATSGGAAGALKSIGAALIGPAGLFLAFTAVTSAITFAIQEYGSLTNAINVLFGANGAAVKAQNEFNKALADGASNFGVQTAKINILVKTIQSETTTQNERLAAYRELKRISPEVVAGIDEQNLATARSIQLVGDNAKAVLELLKLQVKQKGIESALGKLEEERFAINGKYLAARREELALDEEINAAKERQAKNLPITSRQNVLITKEKGFRDAAAESVKKYSDEIANNSTRQQEWYKSLETNLNATSLISSNLETLNNNLKRQGDEANKSAESMQKLNIQTLDFFKYTKDLEKLNFIQIFTNFPLFDINKIPLNFKLDKNKLDKIDTKNILEDINTKIFIDSRKLDLQIAPLIDLQFPDEEFESITKKLKDLNFVGIPEMQKFKQAILENLISGELDGIPVTYELIAKKITEAIQRLKDSIEGEESYQMVLQGEKILNEELIKQEKQRISNINTLSREFRFLQEPLQNLIGTALEGAGANWKEFADTVIAQIKRIIAALAAKALVQGLINILTPGSGLGGAITSGLKGISTEGLGDYLAMFGEGAANFSGVQPGGLQMAGAVNLTLRGNDLVGAINRTNTNINRVG